MRSLEDKITNRIVTKIEENGSTNVKKVFEQNPKGVHSVDEHILRHEVAPLKIDWLFLESEIGNLSIKTDHILGSPSYIANKYDGFSKNYKTQQKLNQNLFDDIDNLNKSMKQIAKQQNETVKQLDDLK